MNKSILIILCVLTLACSEQKPVSEDSGFSDVLLGKWSYEPQPITGDTLFHEISNDQGAQLQHVGLVRKLDSGLYEFQYANGELTEVHPYKNIWIDEFSFTTDTSGIFLYYELDTTMEDGQTARDMAYRSAFRVRPDAAGYVVIFGEDDVEYASLIRVKGPDMLEIVYEDSSKVELRKY